MASQDVMTDPSPLPAHGGTGVSGPAVAYLVSRYPSLSHTFIENEVEALRAAGVEVHTFSVRPSPAEQQRSERSRREAGSTTTLLGDTSVPQWLRVGARALTRSPGSLLAGLRLAARSGPATTRGRLWQLFYLAEATLLLEHLRARGVRHVHVHFANNGADIARLAVAVGSAADGPEAGWRWTFSMHGPTEFDAVDDFDLPAKVRSADAVACISEYCRRRLAELVPVQHHAKLGLVRMAVDADRFADASAERAARGSGPLRVLFVGRLVPEKGPAVLLDAVAALRRGVDPLDVRLRVVGAGPLAEELAAQVERDGLAEVVELVGPLGNEQLPVQYAWADVFCLPSFAEGVPVVLMEALATALPVVTTAIAGIPELVRDGVEGRLVPPGDSGALVAALRGVAALDAEGRRALGSAGRRRVREEFSPVLNAERLREVLAL
ncbi:glycosyltransferase family 4 protein [Kineococcus auxinigenes]|uniref:glycosyltransferase family 4 protein n=1 Tax=unclassified Kineococcus TaxID=2621656 RepID=UPI003D7D0DD8